MKSIDLALFLIALSLLFSIPPIPSAEAGLTPSIIQDNFNSYQDGSIVGQGGWINRVRGNNFQVFSIDKVEKIVYNDSLGDSVITKTGTPLENGRQSLLVLTFDRSSWGEYRDGNAQVRISKGNWDSLAMAAVSFKRDGNVAYYDPGRDAYVNFATYNDYEFTLLDIEWRSSDKKARYRVNAGTWTDWQPFRGGSSFTNFDTVGFDFVLPSGSGGVLFDELF